MADRLGRGDRERAADRLAEILEAVIMPVARSADRQPTTAATPEQVDTIKALSQIGRILPDFCRRAILGETNSDDWANLSDILALAARACREQVVIVVDDTGDSGWR